MSTAKVDYQTFTITFERRLDASAEDVFDAWTHPEDMTHWWDPTGAPLKRCEIDLRVGGAFTFETDEHGPPFSGVYRVIDRPKKLVFDALGSVGTVALNSESGTTHMKVEIRCSSLEHLKQFLKLGVDAGTDRTLNNLVERMQKRVALTAR
jgi:uncharacterized protein YndB with AHSA1/START domain